MQKCIQEPADWCIEFFWCVFRSIRYPNPVQTAPDPERSDALGLSIHKVPFKTEYASDTITPGEYMFSVNKTFLIHNKTDLINSDTLFSNLLNNSFTVSVFQSR